MPDDVVFVDEIPHTATGKIQKIALRERFGAYRLPTAARLNRTNAMRVQCDRWRGFPCGAFVIALAIVGSWRAWAHGWVSGTYETGLEDPGAWGRHRRDRGTCGRALARLGAAQQ